MEDNKYENVQLLLRLLFTGVGADIQKDEQEQDNSSEDIDYGWYLHPLLSEDKLSINSGSFNVFMWMPPIVPISQVKKGMQCMKEKLMFDVINEKKQ